MGDDPRRDLITRHIERHMGGRVVSITQQPRWRPTWFLDLERDGETLPLCVRGERSDTVLAFPLEHEMRFQRVLQDNGVPVPGCHTWIDELPAIVMDRVPGRPDFAGVDEADRERIVEEYFDTLARMHTLPLDAFDAAGIARAPTPESSGSFAIVKMFADLFHAQKAGPDPFCEWAVGWIMRHLPESHGREAPIVWDSGQLHHDDHRLVSLIDFELGHVGDPMMDLAALRMRDSVIPFGNFESVYAKYEIQSRALGGPSLDMEAIELHHIAFTITNELSFGHTLRSVVPASDFGTNLQWCNETNIYVTEAIGDFLGVELPEVDVPPPSDVPQRTSVASQYLAQLLRSAQIADPMERYRLRGAFRVAQHVARCAEIGDAITVADLDDAHQVLGHRPASWFDGEVELEQFVLADAAVGRHDDVLLPLFHRRNLRAQMLNGPAGSAMARHNPIQRFPLGPRVSGSVV